jgi:hypothetical protein
MTASQAEAGRRGRRGNERAWMGEHKHAEAGSERGLQLGGGGGIPDPNQCR